MLPRSRVSLAFFLALPLVLLIPLWQAAQNRPHLWGVLSAPVTSLALSHDGSLVAFQGSDGTLGVWPRGEGHRYLQREKVGGINMATTNYSPAGFRFSADDQTLLGSDFRVADSSTGLYAWDVKSGRIQWSALSSYNDDLARYWPSRDGKRVAQRSYDVVKVLDISGTGAPQKSKTSEYARAFPVLTRFRPHEAGAKGKRTLSPTLALSPDGKTLVLATQAGQLQFWDVLTSQFQSQTPAATTTTSGEWELQYSPNGRFVARFDGTALSVWDITAHKWSTTTVASGASEAALAWMPDSSSLWTGAGTIQQWSVPALKSLRELPVSGPLAVSSDGRTLITRALSSSNIPNGIWAWNIG